jgi:guanosine-3',5'-bis(diphosphate) 3'-pyrophosphohydrolase
MDSIPARGLGMVMRAVLFAAEKHRGQVRKATQDGVHEAYIEHPMGVAIALFDAGVTDYAVLCAAYLHDVVEDTDTTLEEIEQMFDARVAGVAAEVTDDASLSSVARKKMQVVHARSMSIGARLVKLADALDNLRGRARGEVPCSFVETRGYFCWKWHVMQAMPPSGREAAALTAALLQLMDSATLDGVPILPAYARTQATLDAYYALIDARYK